MKDPEEIEQEEVEQEDGDQDLFEHHRIVADKGQMQLRIDKFLSNRLQNASRNRIQNAAKAGSILVNGDPVKSNYKIKPDDVVSIVLAYPPRDKTIVAENIPLDIVYEDEALLIVNKKPGMVVHPGYNNFTGTLVHALTYHFQNLPTMKGNDATRPGLVHRIDKDTSGLLLIAKDEVAMTHLAAQFFNHSIERTYQAIVWGVPDPPKDRLEGYINRSLKDRRVMQFFEEEEKGKVAITHYEVVESFAYASLIKCQLETGRTHQIRAHMKSIGHPIFNDVMYGGDIIKFGPTFTKYKQFITNCYNELPRQALHASTLGFIHPFTKKKMFFETELPADMSAVVEKWRKLQA